MFECAQVPGGTSWEPGGLGYSHDSRVSASRQPLPAMAGKVCDLLITWFTVTVGQQCVLTVQMFFLE